MVEALPKNAPPEADVTLTKGAQSSTSVLGKDCIEIIYLAASNAKVDDVKGEGVEIQKFSRNSDATVGIVAQLG